MVRRLHSDHIVGEYIFPPSRRMLIVQGVLLVTNALISHQFASGYVTRNGSKWDDRMHILINITSCGTLIGQAWTKTAFGVTLLKLSNKWQQYVLWFCIITMGMYKVASRSQE